MTLLDRALDNLIAVEGGYVNDSRDAGGETRYGITVATARANGYQGDMRELPLDLAKKIYTAKYWTAPGFDRVAVISESVAGWLLDCGVNMGPETASAMLQRSLNALSQGGYPPLEVDGKCGPATVSALREYLRIRSRSGGESVLMKCVVCLRGNRYIELVENRPQNASFLFGWMANRISL